MKTGQAQTWARRLSDTAPARAARRRHSWREIRAQIRTCVLDAVADEWSAARFAEQLIVEIDPANSNRVLVSSSNPAVAKLIANATQRGAEIYDGWSAKMLFDRGNN